MRKLTPNTCFNFRLPLGSIGNQAASNGYNPNFYNHAARKSPTSKLLVGSTFVNPKDPPSPSSNFHTAFCPLTTGLVACCDRAIETHVESSFHP